LFVIESLIHYRSEEQGSIKIKGEQVMKCNLTKFTIC